MFGDDSGRDRREVRTDTREGASDKRKGYTTFETQFEKQTFEILSRVGFLINHFTKALLPGPLFFGRGGHSPLFDGLSLLSDVRHAPGFVLYY